VDLDSTAGSLGIEDAELSNSRILAREVGGKHRKSEQRDE
jgi:hypothetical protein